MGALTSKNIDMDGTAQEQGDLRSSDSGQGQQPGSVLTASTGGHVPFEKRLIDRIRGGAQSGRKCARGCIKRYSGLADKLQVIPRRKDRVPGQVEVDDQAILVPPAGGLPRRRCRHKPWQ